MFVPTSAEGVPKFGVVSVGLLDNTTFPEPVEVVTPVPPRETGRVPVVPPSIGSPVALVKVAEVGVPRIGVTSVGLVDNTLLPEPVDVVTPVPPLATGNVPVTPVVKGSPVTFVSVPDAGVPKTGAVNVGLANVGEIKWFVTCATFVPSDQTDMVLPAGMAIVVPPLNVIPFLVVELEMVAT